MHHKLKNGKYVFLSGCTIDLLKGYDQHVVRNIVKIIDLKPP